MSEKYACSIGNAQHTILFAIQRFFDTISSSTHTSFVVPVMLHVVYLSISTVDGIRSSFVFSGTVDVNMSSIQNRYNERRHNLVDRIRNHNRAVLETISNSPNGNHDLFSDEESAIDMMMTE